MNAKQWGQIVSKAWADEQFKQRLLADPAEVLKEKSVTVPAGMTVNVVENTNVVCNLTLPLKPSEAAELTEDELESIAGGRTLDITTQGEPGITTQGEPGRR